MEPITLAIIYDFDGTLAPGNMQDHRFIPDAGVSSAEFWDEVNRQAEEHRSDSTLTYMYLMLETAQRTGAKVRREDLMAKSTELQYFPGVEEWFGRINRHGSQRGVAVEHYIISSGNSEIIEGCSIASEFKKIYASRFIYNEEGEAVWPALAINFTTKTQYLFRINKGAHDLTDREAINRYVPRNERTVPFEQMVYIGDGETDIPCFRLVKDLGGLSIAVYDTGQKEAADRYRQDDRVNCVLPANYEENGRLDQAVRSYIKLVAP